MSTVHNLVTAGVLELYEIANDPRLPSRCLYATADFATWFADELPKFKPDLGEITPFEQIEDIFERYILGERLVAGSDLKLMTSYGPRVWALRTADIRVFGFFHLPCCLIAVCGEEKRKLKKHKLYRPHVAKVKAAIAALDLDEPKVLLGARTVDVL